MLACVFGILISIVTAVNAEDEVEPDVYSFTVKRNDGHDYSLERYRGQVTLIVNVASECGYTDAHYKALTKLQESLGQQEKFTVLAFPCNQFGNQEPKDNVDIWRFALDKYNVNFPIFDKLEVTGPNAHPLFKHLAEKGGIAPSWNFWKYLVNPEGKVMHAWGPQYAVDMIFDDVWREVEKAGGEVVSTLFKEAVKKANEKAIEREL